MFSLDKKLSIRVLRKLGGAIYHLPSHIKANGPRKSNVTLQFSM